MNDEPAQPSPEPGKPRSNPNKGAGTPKPELGELVRCEDRLTFLYFEHCVVNRDNNAITVTDDRGVRHIPAAALSVLMLGPGTSVTHQAMMVIGDNGATVIWVGERGVRTYCSGKPLTHSSNLLQKQAQLVTNMRKRLSVARAMYAMRFPHEDVSNLTMQQLRGREGARVRRVYRHWSKQTGVRWERRDYRPEDFADSDRINQALSAANICLYGIAHAVIVALGCSPGLGFVHTGHELSFVYDMADLYKAELSIPVAFKTAATEVDDIGGAVRRAMRDAMYDLSIMPRMVKDIHHLFDAADAENEGNNLYLWDGKEGTVEAGRSYGDIDDSDEIEGILEIGEPFANIPEPIELPEPVYDEEMEEPWS
ncbi:type I-E CRISPR-associated endonuclease Cas1e [Bifidobacterium gallicum]|uniref:CRISPR-associated endonuclease Cas1 n=1 Tax=Bifidobacterium gallicum DSM 20093 = LMG 11596 TaxID=561180 RepID=D1NTI3_9BIFI|nr:type I-E CRISPR-associated endonuclease Cas1e [Bifidobacterium gallicum]EFA23037.1 CRISPR-associated endonuclease Cas1 [Bifidobacterium gallicum DSM 20093 = LMG 11596]KFI57655.1 CRISPR-associated protein Cse1 [Bifidobacterium gallicum DSM 20093 = LMG 11596]